MTSATEEVLKEGWLFKQAGKMFKTWNRRYFKLTSQELQYDKAPKTPMKNSIKLTKISYVALAPDCKRQPAFKFEIPDVKTYYFVTEAPSEATAWVNAIECYRTSDVDMKDIQISDFEVDTHLHQSQNCSIQRVKNKLNQQFYVIKRYGRFAFAGRVDEIVNKEKEFLSIGNPFVTSLRQILCNDMEVCMIYDYVPNGCLFTRLLEEGKFDEKSTAFYSAEILLALSYLHQHGALAGKLTPNSILICPDGHIKVTEPGPQTINPMESNEYTAPELLDPQSSDPTVLGGPQQVTAKTDIYNFGLLVYYMLCGMPPFYDDDKEIQKKLIRECRIFYPHHVSDNARSFISELMNVDPEKRPDLEKIKTLKFFSGISWEMASAKQLAPPFIPSKQYLTLNEYERNNSEHFC
ncbi:AGC family protein kinase [Histomonas meleagridis]|uniref:AGC family protein kinase n=1 Tax=Histomonas meleagridis TaxID=135588 RepID=UPI00355ABD34|nr:AGC family protein kinase [Histomonas meleagridis]KAH0799462.1 AGC family protein kinase [Histomonas meleagridis]